MAWPNPLHGNIHIPPYAPHPLESLVSSLTTLLTPFITPNNTVAIYRLPQTTTLATFFAITRLKAIPVFLNHRYKLSEVVQALNVLPTTTLITQSLTTPHSHILHQAVSLILTIPISESPFYSTVIPSLSPTRTIPTPDLPHNTAAVFFTSGTTTTPKPVPLTYNNLTSQSLSKISFLNLSKSTTYLHLAPLYHLSGFSSTLSVVLSKATHVLPQNHHPSNPNHASNLLSLIRQYSVTLLVAVPAVFRLLLDAADHKPFPTITTILYGGSAASHSLLRDLRTTFPNSEIIGTYAMTETASSLTLFRGNPTNPSRPLPHVKLAVLRDDHTILETGHGEILTKGPHVFPGYYGRPRHAFIHDWFRTGDIGHLTHTGLILLGRKLDMIKSGGEKVYAGEVESVLITHSAVREAAVVGVPDRILGEAVAACVVLVADVRNDMIQILTQFCRNALAHFKCPRWILTTPQLPRNATGKVIKTRVRQMLENNLTPRAKL